MNAKKVLRRFRFAPNLWRNGGKFTKERRKMALIFKARAKTNFDQRQIARGEQVFGAFDSLPHQVLLRCHSRPPAKNAEEMKRAEFGDRGEFGKRHIVFQIFADKFLDAPPFITRKPAVHGFRRNGIDSVIFEQMQQQSLFERINVKPSRIFLRVGGCQQS